MCLYMISWADNMLITQLADTVTGSVWIAVVLLCMPARPRRSQATFWASSPTSTYNTVVVQRPRSPPAGSHSDEGTVFLRDAVLSLLPAWRSTSLCPQVLEMHEWWQKGVGCVGM